jgi:hypothetical protein
LQGHLQGSLFQPLAARLSFFTKRDLDEYPVANVLNVRYINAMDVKTINHILAEGNIDRDDMWPRIVEMKSKAHQFRFEFGLNELPKEPGLIIIRGPRQYGKSTWLDMNLRWSAVRFHPSPPHLQMAYNQQHTETTPKTIQEKDTHFSPTSVH